MGTNEMAAMMRTAPVARVAPVAPKASKARVQLAAPKAFFGATKAFRAASFTTKAKASKMVTKASAEADVARSYASALLELASSTGSLEAIHAAKEGGFSAATTNFLSLLVSKGRITLLSDVIAEFDALYCAATDTQVATVTSAVKLENEQQFLIAKKLQEMTGAKNIKLKPQVDESLIGGFVVKYGPDGSSQVDMSVKGQLDKIANSLVAVSA